MSTMTIKLNYYSLKYIKKGNFKYKTFILCNLYEPNI